LRQKKKRERRAVPLFFYEFAGTTAGSTPMELYIKLNKLNNNYSNIKMPLQHSD
jgi:hypothetical protein